MFILGKHIFTYQYFLYEGYKNCLYKVNNMLGLFSIDFFQLSIVSNNAKVQMCRRFPKLDLTLWKESAKQSPPTEGCGWKVVHRGMCQVLTI